MLDGLLLVLLLVGVPALMLWCERQRLSEGEPPRLRRYLESALLASALMGLLAADLRLAGRSLGALGFDFPLSTLSLDLILAAATGLAALTALSNIGVVRGKPPSASTAILPATRVEFIAFLALSLLLGVAWEALFRGYLLYALTPVLGPAGAVAMASIVYAAAHGVADLKRFVASLIAAVAFTLAYAFSHSLWWLIILHAGLPIVGAAAHIPVAKRGTA